ncbi:MAG: hypothetical protein EBT07_05340 [Actinobacteria bacterium]|nr:hypothetical protein [Actinomycetota bacterium]
MFKGMGASDRIRFIKAQTLSAFHQNNPTTPDTGKFASSPETLLLRNVGTQISVCGCNTCQPVSETTAYYFNFVYSDISDVEDFILAFTGETVTIPYPPGYPVDRNAYFILFYPNMNATTYAVQFTVNGIIVGHTDYFIGQGESVPGILVFYPNQDTTVGTDDLDVVLSTSNACSSNSTDATYGCFLEGSPVTMADGTTKPIETVRIGDKVRGAFGETNTVTALHQPIVGSSRLCNINNEHRSTTHHPHISADKKFYLVEPNILANMTYGRKHTVINADGTAEKRIMTGVAKERLLKLVEGVELQTVTGPRTVRSITYEPISPFTKVYHLVIDGSHTYNVDGYAVVGWATETDFNYDTWTPK